MQGSGIFAAILAALVVFGTGMAFGAQDDLEAGEASTATAQSASPQTAGPSVELESKRTATSQTFRLANGSLETRVYETPINYLDDEGSWQPIDADLRPAADAALTNGANQFDLSLPNRLGEGSVRLSTEDGWVAYELQGPETKPVEAEGNVASYEAADPGVTFELSSLPIGLKENIVIAGPSDPSAFNFKLTAANGLSPISTEDGSIEFHDEAGQTMAVIAPPTMADSTPGQPQVSRAVSYQLEPHGEGEWLLTVEADREWLSDPARVWPVAIDPTVTTLAPSLDCAYGGVKGTSGWRGCGASGWQNLSAAFWAQPEGQEFDHWARSALRFDLSAIPQSSYVTGTTLGLYAPAPAQSTSGVEAIRALKTWTSSLDWKTYNGTSAWTNEGGDFSVGSWHPADDQSLPEGALVATSDRGSQAGWWEFSGAGMADLAQKWVSKSISNQGLIVKLQDDKLRECPDEASCVQRFVSFNSSAYPESTLRPYMKVNYYPAAPSTSKVVSPAEGTVTSRRLKLKAGWSAQGTTGVTFQYRNGTGAVWQTIPSTLIQNGKGEQVNWPLAVQGSQSEALYFDAFHAEGISRLYDTKIQVRALFEGSIGAAGYSAPRNATVNPKVGGPRDAVAAIGPGSLNLLTGNYTITRTDVSIPIFGTALEFARTHTSRDTGQAAAAGVLGWGWKPSATVEAAGGAEWRKLRDANGAGEGSYALLTDLEGYEYAFEQVGENYITSPEAAGLLLARQDATHIALTDPSGNRTLFEKEASGYDYVPVSVSQTGSGPNATRMVYQLVGGKKRLSAIIAPNASGITCTESNFSTTLGCRALTFSYLPASNWGAPSGYGDRLATIKYFGPASASANSSWEVAKYSYDSEGRLIAEWDPRTAVALEGGGTGYLKESYAYLSKAPQLSTLTPPGEEPWSFEYDYVQVTDLESVAQRLRSVKRASLLSNPSVAQTTIAYDVPLSGSAAPYSMSPTAVAQWGQQDIPTDATAIFPPDQMPAEPPTSYSRATLYYMNAEGQLVNTAMPSGAGTEAPSITTSEHDEYGNVVRELSPQNRLRALAAGSEAVARSHELETKRNFSADGTEMQEEWGPLHEVRLESGSTVQARTHTTVEYENPTPPAGTPKYHLPTRETVGASIAGQGIDADQRVTETKYNWTLRKPTDTIVDPLDLNLRTHTEYDPVSGMPTERRLPAKPEGGDAHSTKFVYYTPGANPVDSNCANKAAWAGLLCRVKPVTQPGTAGQPEILVTRILTYSPLGQPTETIESPGGTGLNGRVTQIEYDTAGRAISRSQTGNGTPIPAVVTTYSPTTGRPVEQRFACDAEGGCEDYQATTATYDALGRPIAYEDADGNLSSTSYDLLGRPVTTSDGKGIQTRTYDPTSGLLVKLEDSGAGTFAASYDADGHLTEKSLPNGLLEKTTYDEVGSPVHLSYEKTSFCAINCTWLDFDVEESIHGQWLAQTSNLSAQQYSYDNAGRLKLVKDTPQGGGCTTRSYSFDKDSNRTALVTRAPGIGGACDTTSAGTTKSYSYDSADRLLGSGIVYDNYGRITSLPSAYSGGGTLTSTYYTNDLIRSQTQDGITHTYELDATLRQRQRTQIEGSNPGTEIYHYASGSDSPAWIDRGSSWSRSVVGIDGGLAAIQDSAKGTTLQLTNLHGDIVATASTSSEATKLLATFGFDEFGNPKQSGGEKYGWLGGKQRRTELPSGVIQMGVRSYVPAMGRFVSVDPVLGGSANTYDYANADPINSLDLNGTKPTAVATMGPCKGVLRVYSPRVSRAANRGGYGKFNAKYKVQCGATGYTISVVKVTRRYEQKPGSGHVIAESSNTPSNPSGSHWNGAWGNWGRPTEFDCLAGVEYQYTYEIQVQWASPGGAAIIKGESLLPPGQGTLRLQAQQVCGKGGKFH